VYTHGVPTDRLDRVSLDNWTMDQAGLDRPGNKDIQLALFRDYRFNLELYPKFQEYFRTHQPPMLAVWGAHDEIFGPDGAWAFAGTGPTPRSTCWTPGTSRSNPAVRRSPAWSARSCAGCCDG
jgi:hypothetical protein